MKPWLSCDGHVLITGTSTGIGRACALRLAGAGFSVLAGVRSEADAESIERAAPHSRGGRVRDGLIRALILDVTDETSIRRAAEDVRSITANEGLRGLVNNAGVCVFGPVECVPIDDWRRQFEINVIGQIAVTQAMLPHLRTNLKRHGRRTPRIVMISSIAGVITHPVAGAYCASKHALESVSDALRNELKAEGIGVSLVQPGVFRSEIWRKAVEQGSALLNDSALPVGERYAPQIAAVAELARGISIGARPAERVANVVHDCLIRPYPPIRRLVGPDARFVAALKYWLPDRWLDSVLRFIIARKVQQMASQTVVDQQTTADATIPARL